MPGTVTVASKLQLPLRLRLFKMVQKTQPVTGGSQDVKVAEQVGGDVLIRGAALPRGLDANRKGALHPEQLTGGYALTPNVDEDFWNEWLKQNRDLDIVKNNLVFAHGKSDHVHGQAVEREKQLSGMEPLEVGDEGQKVTDPRVPRGGRGSMAIQTAEK